MTDAQMMAALTSCAMGLGTAIWYLIRRSDARIEAERVERTRLLEEQRRDREEAAAKDRQMFLDLYERAQGAWMAAMEKERNDARDDRHDFRDALAGVAADLQRYKLEAAEKFVNGVALDRALAPTKEAIERVEKAMTKVFERLEGKADKGHRATN